MPEPGGTLVLCRSLRGVSGWLWLHDNSTHNSNTWGSLPILAGPGLMLGHQRVPTSSSPPLPRLLIPPKHPSAPVSKMLSGSRQILPKSFAEHGLSACPKPIDKLKHLPSGIIPLELGEARVGANFIFR